MTDALQLAAISTRDRLEQVEKQVQKEHRFAVKLRRAMQETKRQHEERTAEDEKPLHKNARK